MVYILVYGIILLIPGLLINILVPAICQQVLGLEWNVWAQFLHCAVEKLLHMDHYSVETVAKYYQLDRLPFFVVYCLEC